MTQITTPEQRTGLFFFAQFMAGGTANAYAGIWLAQQGLSAEQIDLVNSLPVGILLAINLFVGRIADRASDWRQVIVWGAAASAVASFGLFGSHSFMAILLVMSAAAVAQSMIVPVADAAALHLMARRGGSIGGMRSLSTLGYMLGLLASGFLIGHYGAWLFVPLFAGFSLVRVIAAILLPRFKEGLVENLQGPAHHFRDFLKPLLLLPLLGWSIVYATHFVLNGFQSLLWSQQGFSTGVISLLIGVGALSEAIAFFLFRNIMSHVGLRFVILASGIVTVGRWFAMAAEPGVMWLVALQSLHGITFALGFVACVTYIGEKTPIKVAAEAQSFFLVLQQVAAISVITLFSYLAGQDGARAYTGNALIALLGTLVILVGMQPWAANLHARQEDN